jgi:hypothetical protein
MPVANSLGESLLGRERLDIPRNMPFCRYLSPLPDSNRGPPPYHRSKRQPVAAHGNGFPLVQAILGLLAARTVATRCAPSVP